MSAQVLQRGLLISHFHAKFFIFLLLLDCSQDTFAAAMDRFSWPGCMPESCVTSSKQLLQEAVWF